MGVDFLTGMTLFIFTLFFVLQFMFGMIEPYTSTSTEHVSVADRVAERLVTEELAAENGTTGIINHTKTMRFFNKSDENISEALGVPQSSGFRISVVGDDVTYEPTDGLVGYWSFNERSGRLVRDSSGEADISGTIHGDVDRDADGVMSSSAFGFDNETEGYVRAPVPLSQNISKTDEATISYWVRQQNDADSTHINQSNTDASPRTQYRFEYQAGGEIRFVAGGEIADSGANVIELGRYNHVVGTIDRTGGDVCVFVNGVEENCDSDTPGPFNQTDADTRISYDEPSASFLGSVDEVRIYDRVLSDDEIEHLYNASAVMSPDEPDLATGAALGNTTLTAGASSIPEVASISSRRRVAYIPGHQLDNVSNHVVGSVEVRVQIW